MSEQQEEWRQVIYKGLPLNYDVSSEGRVRNRTTGRIKAAGLTRVGHGGTRYRIVTLADPRQPDRRKTRSATVRVAALVADAFLRPRLPGEQLEHENQISTDDRLANLKIVASQSENILASYKAGNRKKPATNSLTQADYDRIFELHKQGLSQVKIGRIIGCTNSTVSKILSGKFEGPRLKYDIDAALAKKRERDRRRRARNPERCREWTRRWRARKAQQAAESAASS